MRSKLVKKTLASVGVYLEQSDSGQNPRQSVKELYLGLTSRSSLTLCPKFIQGREITVGIPQYSAKPRQHGILKTYRTRPVSALSISTSSPDINKKRDTLSRETVKEEWLPLNVWPDQHL